ncbi:MAG: septal ring lytic transglycosylase RlpA family protein [Flavobacterium sp.]|nr:MAG: septal ring lytic transglycosylase RlpA family protein [Flavobacterium sp.]
MKNSIRIFGVSLLLLVITGFSVGGNPEPVVIKEIEKVLPATATDTAKKVTDSVEAVKPAEPKLTLYKQNVMATYYADKFNGRKTTSGERFHNKKYTAAHMKLPFGTMVRVTNESNGKWVDVRVNDRGPFSKKLEIDLTKTAFMDIASKKGSGSFKVKIEILEEVEE